ncbi:Uncharacterized protein FWK35_00020109 [Aphis craccivora]|uniref:Uncharacterized protein n=1 Tax=Aphis craccivora TaxID=307492 RepID=A0A6G0YH12_APHCR|nr:Uncharacterized protein FWK35_00020109 [Aphis craccivora]
MNDCKNSVQSVCNFMCVLIIDTEVRICLYFVITACPLRLPSNVYTPPSLGISVRQTLALSFKMNKNKFATLHDFKEWKSKLEDDNLCFYALSARNRQNKNTTYLDCHRTGNFQSRSTTVSTIKSAIFLSRAETLVSSLCRAL